MSKRNVMHARMCFTHTGIENYTLHQEV